MNQMTRLEPELQPGYLMSTLEVSELLGISDTTLRNWRMRTKRERTQIGPKFVQLQATGARSTIRYPKDAVLSYIRSVEFVPDVK